MDADDAVSLRRRPGKIGRSWLRAASGQGRELIRALPRHLQMENLFTS
jgi:hypothetical protein